MYKFCGILTIESKLKKSKILGVPRVVLLHRARGSVLHAGRKADAVVFDGEGIDNNHKRG